MRKPQRMIGLALAALMLISVMPSCSSGADGKSASGKEKKYDLGGRTVAIAGWGDLNPQKSSSTYAQEMQLIDDIQKKYNCKLTFSSTSDWHTYMSLIQVTALSGEKIADAFWANYPSIVPQWVNTDLIAPLDSYFDLSDTVTWNKSTNDEWAYQGKHYGITNWRDALGHVILFNKRVGAENGITDASLYDLQKKGQWTWDKLRELALKCTKDTNNDGQNDVFGFGAYGTSPADPEPFVYSNGASPVKVDSNFHYTYNLNDPKVIAAIQFCYDLVWTDKVCYTGSTDWGTWEGLWKMGKTAFFSVASWNMNSYKDDLDDEIGVMMTPKGPSAKDYVNAQSAPAGIFMQPMVKDKDAIGALLTDYYKSYDWKQKTDAATQWTNWVSDQGSLDSINMVNGRTVSLMGEASTYFRDNVLWSDWGIKSQTNPRSFVESMQAACQQSFDDLISKKLSLADESSAASGAAAASIYLHPGA